MPGAGDLRERVTPLQRALDEQGERLGDWAPAFARDRSAAVQRLRGGEAVMAGRLAGTKPTLITVRSDSETRSIDSDWRVNIAAGPFAGLYEVKAADTSEKRDFISLLCEAAAD